MAMPNSMITEVAREIAARKGITVSHAYKEARKQQLEKGITVPEGWSKRDYVLEALYRLNSNSGVRADTLASALKAMDVRTMLNEVTGMCWDLQKQQLLEFQEAHQKGGSYLTRIRLTPKGRAMIVKKRGTPQNAVIRVNADAVKGTGLSSNTGRGKVHAVGIDKTYYKNHRKVAEGGPIEIVQEGVKPHVPEVIPYVETTVEKFLAKDPEPLPQNMKAPIDEVEKFDLSKFQKISELVERRDHKILMREKAAKFVEAASLIADMDMEEADRLMTKAGEMEGPSLSTFELEVLRLVDSLS